MLLFYLNFEKINSFFCFATLLGEINLDDIFVLFFRKDIFQEVYVTAQSLCFTVYATSEEKNEDGSSKNLKRALLHSEITQPHFLMSDENNSFTVRVRLNNYNSVYPNKLWLDIDDNLV